MQEIEWHVLSCEYGILRTVVGLVFKRGLFQIN